MKCILLTDDEARMVNSRLSQIISRFQPEYEARYGLCLSHRKVLWCIENCRTAAMGGHIDRCTHCGQLRVWYNSCGNRHCPKCQWPQQQKWIKARLEEVLPVKYYHVVFTLPQEINKLAVRHPRIIYNELFRASWSSLRTLCADPKYLGGQIGMISVLHTWGQKLSLHPHIHCIVPGGGLSFDGKRWKSTRRKNFLVPVRALSKLFKHHFLTALKANRKKFDIPKTDLNKCLEKAYTKKWVVFAKRPFAGPGQVIQYLGRYTHRVAISQRRISRIQADRVFFTYKDYKDGSKQKETSLNGVEFIRRFLQHVLPKRFTKIRYYGLLSTRNRKTKLALCQRLAKKESPQEVDENLEKFNPENPQKNCCDRCGKPTMKRLIDLPAIWERPPPVENPLLTLKTKAG